MVRCAAITILALVNLASAEPPKLNLEELKGVFAELDVQEDEEITKKAVQQLADHVAELSEEEQAKVWQELKARATASAASDPKDNALIHDDKFINWHNSLDNATWVAGHNEFFKDMTWAQARPILGAQLSHISEHMNECLDDSVYAAIKDDDIPKEFDARTNWPGLIHPIRDQEQCGSCWAFSASEVLSDRVAIATNKSSPVLSPEDLVSCDPNDMGCNGGELPVAWDYLKDYGLVTDKCFPYTAGDGKAPVCKKHQCADGENYAKTKAKDKYAINGAKNMQKEIMTNGPIQVAFKVFGSFMSYKSGVYQKHFWEVIPEGGHAVKVVGWGTQQFKGVLGRTNNVDYWLVANSWNTKWGDDGFFKIKRGVDACGIETMGPPYAGMPDVGSDSLIV